MIADAGAVAEYEPGSATGGRTTLTRVGAGAIIAGPVGAIVGGMFKKDNSTGYVSVTSPTGEVVALDGPLRDEPEMRLFVQRVNEVARQHKQQQGTQIVTGRWVPQASLRRRRSPSG